MFFIRRVVGQSMLPTLKPQQIVIFRKSRNLQVGQIVCAQTSDREVVKRLVFQTANNSYLCGDAHDSATYFVPHIAIKGILFFKA